MDFYRDQVEIVIESSLENTVHVGQRCYPIYVTSDRVAIRSEGVTVLLPWPTVRVLQGEYLIELALAAKPPVAGTRQAWESFLAAELTRTDEGDNMAKTRTKTVIAQEDVTSRGRFPAAEQDDKTPLQASQESLLRIPLDRLIPWPGSPEPTANEVQQMAVWLKQDGQQQPVVVWKKFDGGEYRIVDGLTRLRGAEEIALPNLQCVVRSGLEEDAEGEAVASNSRRRVENPIRQAQWCEVLIARELAKQSVTAKTKDRDRAVTAALKEAATLFGVATADTMRSRKGLLKLPKYWQTRVIEGEIPETAAWALIPYADIPELLSAFLDDFQEAEESAEKWGEVNPWRRKDGIRDAIASVIQRESRPMDGVTTVYDPELHGDIPRLFAVEDGDIETLQVVRVPIGDAGKLVEVALNVEAWDRRNRPMAKGQRNKRAFQAAEAGLRADREKPLLKEEKEEPTKEELARLAKEKKEQLARRVQGWTHGWKKRLIAEVLEEWGGEPTIRDHAESSGVRLLLDNLTAWLITGGLPDACTREAMAVALSAQGMKVKTENTFYDVWAHVRKAKTSPILMAVTTLFLREDTDPKIPMIPFRVVEDLANDLEIDDTEEWARLQGGAGKAGVTHPDWEAFLRLHERDQLASLMREWDIYCPEKLTRGAVIDLVLQQPKVLPLPKCLGKVKGAK